MVLDMNSQGLPFLTGLRFWASILGGDMLESMKIDKAHKETWVPKMAKNGSTPKTANTQLISIKSPGTRTGGHHVRSQYNL